MQSEKNVLGVQAQEGCALKSKGDANCDGQISNIDFEIWRQEFLKIVNTTNANFNFEDDDIVSLLDYEIWREQYLASPIYDCGENCAPLTIEGDEEATLPGGRPSFFRGFADPSMRKDPLSDRLWLGYSWPNIHVVNNSTLIPGIDTHLAYSDDNGAHWQFSGTLFPSYPDTNPLTGATGYTVNEVVNLLPVEKNGQATWYAVHLTYFIPQEGGLLERPIQSFRMEITRAASPPELADSPAATLGAQKTAQEWGVDIYLSDLSPEVADCKLWNEPALYYENDTLYTLMRCLRFTQQGKPDTKHSNQVVFATDAQGDIKSWNWRYVGSFAGEQAATELGGEGLTQLDIVKSKHGDLLAIMTPDTWSTDLNEFIHYGCRVVKLDSIDPPVLSRNQQGQLDLVANILATDLDEIGPAACTYDPNSVNGIIMTRRMKNAQGLSASLHQTYIKP